MSEKPEVIDIKTYETSLSVERGLFRRRQVPAVVEACQLRYNKDTTRSTTALGAISLISIGDDMIKYSLALQRGGDHRDLRLSQASERICYTNGTSITDTVTKGWNSGDSGSIVYAWYDRDSLKDKQPRPAEVRMAPKALLVGCYVLHELMQAVKCTAKLPNDLTLTNNDITQSEKSKYPGVYVEGISADQFFDLAESVYR